jgi:RNA polymerase sigma-70 factor (ECF subfamily)
VLYATYSKARVPEAEWIALVQAIAAGDQGALYALYGRMHRIVFTSVLRLVKSRESAEEITVDVFHALWKRASSYDPAAGTVVAWIMSQARSRTIDRLRFEQRVKRTNPHPGESPGDGFEVSAQEVAEIADQQRLLQDALAILTQPERDAIETAYLSEYTYVETAARLNEPLGTIKTRIRSGLAKLRRVLATGSEKP